MEADGEVFLLVLTTNPQGDSRQVIHLQWILVSSQNSLHINKLQQLRSSHNIRYTWIENYTEIFVNQPIEVHLKISKLESYKMYEIED